jgi:hypothetical protein
MTGVVKILAHCCVTIRACEGKIKTSGIVLCSSAMNTTAQPSFRDRFGVLWTLEKSGAYEAKSDPEPELTRLETAAWFFSLKEPRSPSPPPKPPAAEQPLMEVRGPFMPKPAQMPGPLQKPIGMPAPQDERNSEYIKGAVL